MTNICSITYPTSLFCIHRCKLKNDIDNIINDEIYIFTGLIPNNIKNILKTKEINKTNEKILYEYYGKEASIINEIKDFLHTYKQSNIIIIDDYIYWNDSIVDIKEKICTYFTNTNQNNYWIPNHIQIFLNNNNIYTPIGYHIEYNKNGI